MYFFFGCLSFGVGNIWFGIILCGMGLFSFADEYFGYEKRQKRLKLERDASENGL